jgi:hypothetical protein
MLQSFIKYFAIIGLVVILNACTVSRSPSPSKEDTSPTPNDSPITKPTPSSSSTPKIKDSSIEPPKKSEQSNPPPSYTSPLTDKEKEQNDLILEERGVDRPEDIKGEIRNVRPEEPKDFKPKKKVTKLDEVPKGTGVIVDPQLKKKSNPQVEKIPEGTGVIVDSDILNEQKK